MTPFLTEYFARTGWQQPVSVDIETLRALHLQHNSTIPFENIDVCRGRSSSTINPLWISWSPAAAEVIALSKTVFLSGCCVR